VSRPKLEVADIFRDHGAAWRSANAGHVSLEQLKVMSAIERCRTAALGGHVERCENCSHTIIAYNSCRNRHCPKCQGAAAREWLAEREAELLPMPYYHVVFTLPARIADIAYQNKAVIYDLLFKASSETMLTIAADPNHLGARIGFLSVLHTWGSAMTHHPHVHMIVPGGGFSLDGNRWVACRPRFFLAVPVLSELFRALLLHKLRAAYQAGELQFFGRHARLIDPQAFAAYLRPLYNAKWVVYCKRPLRRTQGSLALSRPLHPPRRHLQSPLARMRSERRHLQVEGLQARRPRALQGDDAPHPRVHPPLPHACAARRLPSHPLLWPARQRQTCREHRSRTRAAHAAHNSHRCHQSSQQQCRGATDARASLPVLIIIERFEPGSTPHHHPSPARPVIRMDTS
jgi:hypothetical protein